jgi:hypothetical protein
MGRVFEALDRVTQARVAVKLLAPGPQPDSLERLRREAQVLASIRHAGILRHIDDGSVEDGQPYLVTEWLEGETLSARLERDVMSVAETLTMARGVASALAAAHHAGLVHRDIKPSNVFLEAGDPCRVKLLDFGLAKVQLKGSPLAELTRSGMVLGTPGYMAPEQLRGEREIGPSADVFSLGCVLFLALAGRPPFLGGHFFAVLGSVLFEDAPRLSSLDVALPRRLEALIASMLEKAPRDRPPDGAAVAEALATIAPEDEPALERAPVSERAKPYVCVVLAAAGDRDRAAGEPRPAAGPEPTQATQVIPSLASLAEARDARIERLADGTVLLEFAGAFPVDMALRAAHAALALRAAVPGAPIAVAMGRAAARGRQLVGEAFDAAASILSREEGIRVDDAVASLLDGHATLRRTERETWLMAAGGSTRPRDLLGKPTPFVGRARDLAALEAHLEETIGERTARAVLVTGVAGVGKSRLRYELLRRATGAEIWSCECDPMRTRSPFAVAGEVLRQALSLEAGEDGAAWRARIRERIAGMASVDGERVATFLAEMCGASSPDLDGQMLAAARQDPLLMGDQLRSAWEDWLAGELDVHPVLLVIEDVHWADPASLKLFETTLHSLGDRPLMVLGFGRPESRELMGHWKHTLDELRLRELSRTACERLVRFALGAGVAPETVAKVVDRAEGNPFYLEEIIRAAADGRVDEAPSTVLATIEARLSRLPVEDGSSCARPASSATPSGPAASPPWWRPSAASWPRASSRWPRASGSRRDGPRASPVSPSTRFAMRWFARRRTAP